MTDIAHAGVGRYSGLRLVKSGLKEGALALGISGGVALWLHVSQGVALSTAWVYALCIGMCIQGLIRLGRYGFLAWARWCARADEEARAWHAQVDWPGWWRMGPWIVVCVPLGYFWGGHLAAACLGHDEPRHLSMAGREQFTAVGLVLAFAVTLVVTYVFHLQRRFAQAEVRAEQMRRTALEQELQLLHVQLEPHMLFNTLANVRVLMHSDALQAQTMLDHFIDYLQATLTASRQPMHTLAEEFDRVQAYLTVMRIRMGSRLQFTMQLPEALRHVQVPPLLLQPLVENAIRHGLEPQKEGGHVEVSASCGSGRMMLCVKDTGVGWWPAPEGAKTGFGTVHVRERLHAVFGPQAQLNRRAAAAGQQGTCVTISWPLSGLEPPPAWGSVGGGP